MSPTPTGRVVPTADGRDLVLTRRFAGSVEDVWASITESERTARWFGSWVGEPGAGNTITITLVAEEGEPTTEAHIDVCDPPHHLALTTSDAMGTWRLEAFVRAVDGGAELEFVHHLSPEAPVGDVGPGWEFYLDRLVASVVGDPLPEFDDYHPAQVAYYGAAAGG